jgi:hypothetical protein
MSQPSVQWTNTATDPLFPCLQQESYTDTQLDETFRQNASDEPNFSSTNEDFDNFSVPSGDASVSQANGPGPSAVYTSASSSHNFHDQSYTHSHSVHGLPCPYPDEHEQTYQTHSPPSFYHRPLPSHAQTNTDFVLSSQLPQGHDRRRSLSHSDVDRVAANIPHPTFVRLQGLQGSRSTTPEHNGRSYPYSRHGRSVSQGPTSLGRPFSDPVLYTFSRSPLVVGALPTPIGTSIGTPIGTPMGTPPDERGSRKRTGYPGDYYCGDSTPEYDDPFIRHVTDPIHLAHSRRIIEIGAMVVHNHTTLEPKPRETEGMSTQECILKKLEDVERYLQQHGADNDDAIKGCALIREALSRRKGSGVAISEPKANDHITHQDSLDLPSKMMPAVDDGLFGGRLVEDDLMNLLTTENKRLIYEKA